MLKIYKSTSLVGMVLALWTVGLFAQVDTLYYDTAPATFLIADTAVGTMVAVRFTPTPACSLLAVQIVTNGGGGSAKLHLWADNGGVPGADLISPVTVTLLGNATYQEFQLPTPMDMGTADFHVGWELLQWPPPYATTDDDGNTDQRSKIYRPSVGSWETLDNDLNIRVIVETYSAIVLDSLYYDGNPGYYLSTYPDSGTMFAVRFTNPNYPIQACSLRAISIVTINGSGGALIHVWADTNGYPAGDLITPFADTLDGDMGRQTITLNPPVYIGTADFHAGWELAQVAPPFATTDGQTNVGQRSKAKEPTGGWDITTKNLNIRAFVEFTTPPDPSIQVIPSLLAINISDTSKTKLDTMWVINNGGGALVVDSINNNANWINSITPSTFTVVFPDTQTVTIEVDPSGLTNGTYYDTISICSNDPDQPIYKVPITLNVELGIDEEMTDVLHQVTLYPVIPNPARSHTTLHFALATRTQVSLRVYNTLGQHVATLLEGNCDKGDYELVWNRQDDNGNMVPSGVYFLQLGSEERKLHQRVVLF